MCGPVSVNLNGRVASRFARAQASGSASVPAPIGPSTTPGGRPRNPIFPARYAKSSSKLMRVRTPSSGRTKYSIMPFVSGWSMSKR